MDWNRFISYTEFREANFFPIEIFRSPTSVSDSVNDADSHDLKSCADSLGIRF